MAQTYQAEFKSVRSKAHHPAVEANVAALIERERMQALSPREFRFRLVGYGYAIKDVEGTQIVTKLPQGTELGVLPTRTI